MATEHGRPDAADDMVSAIVGAARPVVDSAVDKAALLALDAVLRWADELQTNFPGAPPDAHDPTLAGAAAYAIGWDDALAALVGQIRAARNRIQAYHEGKASDVAAI